ncbi:MAG: hypothetical protein JJLCMIEE_03335 [Acidimicrobiales bacterium]|nr:MAG: phosphodiesterase [Actinomycetota bacterium]MBV6510205.1 hypothetical protein [Acidimicrobiales bacterium]RIK03531.1 MAG: hypothetical protein DCC48_16440 [Acidobacteriota bacterium]
MPRPPVAKPRLIASLLVGLAAVAAWLLSRGFGEILAHDLFVLSFPCGLALAALLLVSPRWWAAITAGSALAGFLTAMWSGWSLAMSLASATALAIQPLVAAVFLRWWIDGPITLHRLRSSVLFVVISAFVASPLSASLASGASTELGTTSPAPVLDWWFATAIGSLIVTPVFLTWSGGHPFRFGLARLAEAALLLAATAGLTLWVFSANPSAADRLIPFAYLTYPVIVLAALRFGPKGASSVMAVVAFIAIWFTTRGSGPLAYSTATPEQNLLALQGYLAVGAVLSLLLAAALADRIESQTALALSERRFQAALATSPIGIAVIDLDGRLQKVNRAFSQIVGRPMSEITGSPLAEVEPIHESKAQLPRFAEVLTGEVHSHTSDRRFRRPDGSLVWGRQHVTLLRGTDGRPEGLFLQVEDVTDRKSSEAELAYRASHDLLTGLSNRDSFHEHVDRAIARARRQGYGVAVIFLDLDGFKAVNDRRGHAAGDELLQRVARRLHSVLRPEDLICRYGGDEFVICSEDIYDVNDARQIARRVMRAVAEPFRLDSGPTTISASVGVAMTGASAAHAEALVRDADAAMYRAKEAGRSRMEVFDESMRERSLARHRAKEELAAAITEGQLRLLYQPIIDIASRRLVAVEALVRWAHPVHGVLPPKEFIPVAEESLLIHELGEWVLGAACHQSEQWRQSHPGEPQPSVCVNLSPLQLTRPDFVEATLATLERTGTLPSQMTFEITETVLTDQGDESTFSNLEELGEHGVAFALDDFGTGYSSLANLKNLPITTLKIDRTFVDGLGRDPDDTAIVTGVIGLARSLDLEIVAEGVETADQYRLLADLGCTRVQGYLFSRPRPPRAITRMVFDTSPPVHPAAADPDTILLP